MDNVRNKLVRVTPMPRTGRGLDALALGNAGVSSSFGGSGGPSYWELINADPDTGEVLEQPYIRSQYPTLVDIADGYMQVGTKRLTEISASGILKLSNQDNTPAHFHATGDVVAYSFDAAQSLPIATQTTLGMVKVGSGLIAAVDGTLSVVGGSGGLTSVVQSGSGNAVTSLSLLDSGKTLQYNKDITFATPSDVTSYVTSYVTSTDKNNWNYATDLAHTHNNKSYLDTINQGLGTSYSPTFNNLYTNGSVYASGDVIAYNYGLAQSLPIASGSTLGLVKIGSGLTVAADGTISATGGGSGGVTSVTTAGSGNAFTAASISGSVLTLTKGITFATAADLSSHTGNTTIHITASERTTWNGKQDKLVAGTGITITGTTISATGGGGGGAIPKVQVYNNSTTSYTEYIGDVAVRCGYMLFSGTLAPGASQDITLWNVPTSSYSCVASLRLPAGYGTYGLVCNTKNNGAGNWLITLYNPTSTTVTVSSIQAYYIALMPS